VTGETVRVGDITLYNVHSADRCAGRVCIVHSPTVHHMTNWPLHWRDDRGIFERICEHGIGHPDPDQRSWFVISGESGVHGCDGCCVEPN
jgi:hypothetical protein